MIQRFLLVAMLLGMLTGCVDTMDSVAREYRNAINECIDAMMMITTETQAQQMTTRVFKPSQEKFQLIDRKLKVFEANRTTIEFVKEAFEADGMYLLFSELEYNRQRFALERTRLRHVKDDIMKAHREMLIAQGEPNPVFTADQCCPKLDLLLREASALAPLENQLKNPPLMAKVEQMNMRLKADKQAELGKIFEEKRKQFDKGAVSPLVN